MKCAQCGGDMNKTVLARHEYVESGLPNVVLHNVPARTCATCGEMLVSIPRLTELHGELVKRIASKEARLTGAEVRFLRKHLGWSGVDFAARMAVDPSTVSRWENDKESVGPQTERAIRLMAMHGRPVEEYPLENLAHVANPQAAQPSFELTMRSNRWRSKNEAA